MALNGIGNYDAYDKWRLQGQDPNKPLGVNQPSGEVKEKPPVDENPQVAGGYQATLPFSMNVGATSFVEGVNGVYGVGRVTPPEGRVQSEDGSALISFTNSQGHMGLTEMADGAGEHYDPLNGHAKHKNWFVA